MGFKIWRPDTTSYVVIKRCCLPLLTLTLDTRLHTQHISILLNREKKTFKYVNCMLQCLLYFHVITPTKQKFNIVYIQSWTQFDFQKFRNKKSARLSLIEKLSPAFELKEYANSPFVSYSAGLYILSRSTVFDILEGFDVRFISSDFINAYFTNRSQYVCYETVKSAIRC